MVCFYLGCSFGFEGSLKEAGIPVRNVEQGTNVSMYKVTTDTPVPPPIFIGEMSEYFINCLYLFGENERSKTSMKQLKQCMCK